jgi:ribosomal protein L40E
MTPFFIFIAAIAFVFKGIHFFVEHDGFAWSRRRVCSCRRFATQYHFMYEICPACGADLPSEFVVCRAWPRLVRSKWEVRGAKTDREIAKELGVRI